MRQARLLAEWNRRLLVAYSRRTTAALQARLPLPSALPWLDRLLLSNVDKEVRKDAGAIAAAVRAVRAGVPIDDALVEQLLVRAAEIDRDFLAGAARTPLEIPLRYAAINPVRRARIRLVLESTHRLCASWSPRCKLDCALSAVMPAAVLEQRVFDMLTSYAQETRILGESVRMPLLLMPLRRRVLSGLVGIMETTARELARETARGITPAGPSGLR